MSVRHIRRTTFRPSPAMGALAIRNSLSPSKNVSFSVRRRRTTPPTKFGATIFRLRPRVELMEDRTLLSTFLVNNTVDSGPGSLRQAILDSNAVTGTTNTIDFEIPGLKA